MVKGKCRSSHRVWHDSSYSSSIKLTHEDRVWGGVISVKVFEDVPDQSHDHHGVDCHDVTHPAVQHPVLQDEPTHINTKQSQTRDECPARQTATAPRVVKE